MVVVVVVFGDYELIAHFGESDSKSFEQVLRSHHHIGWTIGNHPTSK